MFTSVDKALTAIVAALAYLATTFGYTVPTEWIDEAQGVIVAVTPFLVWLFPNKET